MRYVGYVSLAGSLTALGFLAYTLLSLERLGIGVTHPRVLVEAGLGLLLLAVGVFLVR
jgi:hypothetical protein